MQDMVVMLTNGVEIIFIDDLPAAGTLIRILLRG
jgi:hypothetical protein